MSVTYVQSVKGEVGRGGKVSGLDCGPREVVDGSGTSRKVYLECTGEKNLREGSHVRHISLERSHRGTVGINNRTVRMTLNLKSVEMGQFYLSEPESYHVVNPQLTIYTW